MSSRRGLRAPVGVAVAALLTSLVTVLVPATTAGAQPDPSPVAEDAPLYTPLPAFASRAGRRPAVAPRHSAAYRVNLGGARTVLGAVDAGTRRTFTLPDPQGDLEAFTLDQDPVLAPALAAAHPEITTWAGRSVADPRVTVRLDLTPMGLHASVRSLTGSGTWYVDPAYVARGTTTHLSYYAADLAPDAAEATFVERSPRDAEAVTGVPATPARAGADVVRRTYRLALVNDPSYAAYFGTANVLAEKTTLVNRVNQIYNDDLGVHLVLVAGTAALNLDTAAKATGTNGPCGAGRCFTTSALAEGCTGTLLNQNQAALGSALLGTGAYDVGHIILGENGGGLAGLGVVGGSSKAEGCTGLTTPTGDFFYVDYVAHELGHQFGADHTFAGTNGSCSGNGNPSTAVEPGSGSSVMAYAGICATDDLQAHTDPYFSQASIEEIRDYLASSAPGSAETTANHAPTVTAPADATIPKRTPFTLTASGSDTDGDPLTFLWEQTDPGLGTQLLSASKGSGPLFRTFGTAAEVTDDAALESPSPGENLATGDPSRTFPDLAQVVAGNTDAAGPCPSNDVDCFSEFLPTVSRAVHLTVTARDGFPVGGGTATDTVALQVDATKGPLLVNSQSGGETDTGGSTGTVSWTVNDTDALAPQVRILLSTDGGLSFSTTLVESTTNDGSAAVTWPVGDTTGARVMVQAVGNYFFAVNTAPFTISGSTSGPDTTPPDTMTTSGPTPDGFLLADAATVGIGSSEGDSTFTCDLDGVDVSCSPPSVQLTGLTPGTHALTVTATDTAANIDPSPAVLRWTRPYGAAALTKQGKGWTTSRTAAAYVGRLWETERRGTALTAALPRTGRLALVVGTGRGFGRLQVTLGGRTIGTVRLAAPQARHHVLRVLPAFSPRAGKLTIRTLDGKPVRVEGFGALTAPDP